jgi:hypothetical protein
MHVDQTPQPVLDPGRVRLRRLDPEFKSVCAPVGLASERRVEHAAAPAVQRGDDTQQCGVVLTRELKRETELCGCGRSG